MPRETPRPSIVTVFSIFFLAATAIACTAALALAFPNTFLQDVWSLNPKAHNGFLLMGFWAVLLMAAVSGACLSAALGLWNAKRWGYWLAVVIFAINLAGDVANTIFGSDWRTIVGVPIVSVLLWGLATRRVRTWFGLR